MKKYLLSTVIGILLIPLLVFAQEQDELVITGAKMIEEKFTPSQIVDSINKRFPDAQSIMYFKAPRDASQRGWSITEDDNLPEGEGIDYYTVSFKQADMKYYGLYDKDGNLLQSKIEESVDQLPEAVRTSLTQLGELHPGYTVVSKTYYRNQNHSKSKEYYEVIAQKDDEKKKLFFDPDGTLIKTKD